MIETLILSIVQGVTEFLPVSSSSHLILISEFVNFEKKSLSIDVSLHVGSFLAVVVYFYKDIINFFENRELFLKIIISSLPIMVLGVVLVQTNLIDQLRNLKIIGWMTLVFGILLYIGDKSKSTRNLKNNFSYKSAIIIGLFQIFSLIPGVSRMGISVTAARILKFNRVDAGKISFLLSIPTLGAVSIFGFKNLIYSDDFSFSIMNLTGIILSFVFSIITIKYFLKFLEKFSLNAFVIYRIILGLIIIIYSYL